MTANWHRMLWNMARALAVLGTLGTISKAGQAQALGPDVKDGKDHPIVSRFAGSQLIGHLQLEFETGRFYLPRKEAGNDPTKELDTNKPVSREGRVTRLLYVAPAGKTPLEVHRNFEQALKAAGLKVLTAVDGRNAWWDAGSHWRDNFAKLSFQPPFAADISPFDRSDALYVYGTLTRGGVEVAVSVLTGPLGSFAKSHYKTTNTTAQAAVAVQIVEPKPMATGQVTVSAEGIGKGLEVDGRIALYGIYFDTGKAELKPESKAQIDEMVALLRTKPQLRVHIVGHTDNVGTVEANLLLSQRRAEAVAAALVTTHKIDAKRLSARGVASLAPVAGNRNEGGRALNRRVELVEQ
ncbi:MAG: OmpA family protein [Inhella sp.]|uniref:OmpA family protein n=1 Tax=Inhella sp. TaxID=1921806 RepID=UPI0022BB2AC1|nr:OmpA family protein [Inhella sp.]MCZ8235324.1 OmpA family protein [Inhella sp.]